MYSRLCRSTLPIYQKRIPSSMFATRSQTVPISPQECEVKRIPNFFSSDDIKKIFRVQELYRENFSEPPPKRPFWVTTYLSTSTALSPNGLLKETEPELYNKIYNLKNLVDIKCTTQNELSGLQIRCIELHVYAPGGGLGDSKHFDGGSIVTVDIMLDDQFEGGAFQTCTEHLYNKNDHDNNGDHQNDTHTNNNNVSLHVEKHKFELGDALIFPSLKYHQVGLITSGCRKVLVIEFWDGIERHCDHRCHTPQGKCDYQREDIPSFHPPLDSGYFD
mmetsp:Transcript_52424/g.67231  ORF Transcript_52424/g.67231 Transcript_52424/m.67231 type:complete len:275 (+) Transcript_52424:337-1161(+)